MSCWENTGAPQGRRRGHTRFKANSRNRKGFLTARPPPAAFRGALPPHGAAGAPRVGRQRTTPQERRSGEARARAASTARSGQLEPATGVRGREGLQEQRRSLRRHTRHATPASVLGQVSPSPSLQNQGDVRTEEGVPPDPRWLHKTSF